MDTVEMESFSNSQLIVLIFLMFLGGEVFISMLTLIIRHSNNFSSSKPGPGTSQEPEVELGFSKTLDQSTIMPVEYFISIRQSSSKCLVYVVFGYLILIHLSGSILIWIYLNLFPESKGVFESKGIHSFTFVVFTVISSFSNCGFLPTNENMVVFRNCLGFLLIVGWLVLVGNTMYPIGLRLMAWVLMRITRKKEFEFILNDDKTSLFNHLIGGELETGMLGVTVSGFIMLQTMLFVSLEWNSEGLKGMNAYQKVVGSWFMAVNSRHAGESIVDISALSSAVLVLFVVMMYLPPRTTFLPMAWRGDQDGKKKKNKKRKGFMEDIIFSQLSYLAIFIIIICITERKHLSEDPLNFNVLNIVVEVISAYGNVGYTTGYSCKRRLKLDGECRDSWIGFSGRWSREGKIILMLVMIFGRLKAFNMKGGKAWKMRAAFGC